MCSPVDSISKELRHDFGRTFQCYCIACGLCCLGHSTQRLPDQRACRHEWHKCILVRVCIIATQNRSLQNVVKIVKDNAVTGSHDGCLDSPLSELADTHSTLGTAKVETLCGSSKVYTNATCVQSHLST